MTEPPPCARICSMAYLQHRYTEVRLTSCTRRHASTSVVRIESSSGGEIPALLNAMSSPPYSSTATWNSARTSGADVTSTFTYRPPISVAAFAPASSSMSAQTTFAPSSAKRRAVARPIPLPAPVTTATLPARRSPIAVLLSFGGSGVRDEDVLRLGEGKRRVRAELAAQSGRLESAERRPIAHRRVRVHREVAGLDGTADPDGLADVTRPDRSGQPERAVVGDADRVGLVVERDDRHDGAEDLFVQDAIRGVVRREHGRREPVPGAWWHGAAESDVCADVAGDAFAVRGADQRAHLGLVVGRVGDDQPGDGRLEQHHEPVVRAALDEDARPGAAVMTRVVERCIRRACCRRREVSVREDDVGALAAELERHGFDLRGAAGHDLAAHLGRSGEDDLRDICVVDEPLADDAALAGQYLEHVLRDARLDGEFGEAQ